MILAAEIYLGIGLFLAALNINYALTHERADEFRKSYWLQLLLLILVLLTWPTIIPFVIMGMIRGRK